MLYLCIPSYNEAPTVGLLLWRIRKVFQEYSREYEIIVYDDASTDATRETLDPYKKVMPLSVIGGREKVGYTRAVEALLKAASDRTKYPRRDAVVLMQADFTDQPEHLPELVKRFEGGADVVVVERVINGSAPDPVRKLTRLARWLPRIWPIRSWHWILHRCAPPRRSQTSAPESASRGSPWLWPAAIAMCASSRARAGRPPIWRISSLRWRFPT